MSNHHKEGFMEGLFCLLQAPFGAAAATEKSSECTVLIWRCDGCGAGTILVDSFVAEVRMSVRCVNGVIDDASCT